MGSKTNAKTSSSEIGQPNSTWWYTDMKSTHRDLFGHYNLEQLYRQTLQAMTEDMELSDIDRQVLFVVVCMAEISNGICYDPERYQPASSQFILTYAEVESSVFYQSFERLEEAQLLRYMRERTGEFYVVLDEYVRYNLAAAVSQSPYRLFLLKDPSGVNGGGDAASSPSTGQRSRTGYVMIYHLSNGYYWIEAARDPASRQGQIARETGLEVSLVHTIFSSDRQQALTIVHQRYRHRQHHGKWFALSPTELRDLKARKEIQV